VKKKYEVGFPSHCSNEQSEMMHDAVCWFLARFNMQWNGDRSDSNIQKVGITVNAYQYKNLKCWGQCYEWDKSDDVDYVIDIAIDQSIRDMLATVFHECVHLWQWERGHWKGEGEREATQLQYELADEYWRCGNV
tara:strand:+ start:5160 stop:5564 length:405 start_codon:yes stop_codon:yes gene_type:complete